MKKEIHYLIEYLAKSKENPFCVLLLESLNEMMLYTPTRFTPTQISALMEHHALIVPQNVHEGMAQLEKCLEAYLPEALNEGKKALFMTLLEVNFPKKKGFLKISLELFLSQLEPVEKSIYENLLAYISGLNRALALFFVFAKEEPQTFTPESFVHFGEHLHVKLCELIFNDEEKNFLEKGLKELLGVYLTLYGKYLYM
ncbi:MAG: hypothetical protein EOL93_05380 [Epsilonproteobacteria bacterium]|nr:hypothetical protein [Campylobacterota bacterium]